MKKMATEITRGSIFGWCIEKLVKYAHLVVNDEKFAAPRSALEHILLRTAWENFGCAVRAVPPFVG